MADWTNAELTRAVQLLESTYKGFERKLADIEKQLKLVEQIVQQLANRIGLP